MSQHPTQNPRGRWITIGLAAAILFVAGTVGFQQHYAELAGVGRTPFGESIYAALRLFTINFDGDRERVKPWLLEVARWLAPVVVSTGIFQLLHDVFREEYQRIRIRRARAHYIVCGDDENAETLAGQLLEKGDKVLLVRENPHSGGGDEIQRKGAMCLAGRPESPGLLHTARLERAKGLILAMREDRTNVAIAMDAIEICAPHDQPLDIFTHVGDTHSRDLLQRTELLVNARGARTRVTVFNHFQNMARWLWAHVPFEVGPGTNLPSDSVHLILPGLGPSGAAIVLQAARLGHYANLVPVTLHIVSINAADEIAELVHLYPGLTRCCHLTAHEVRSNQEFAARAIGLAAELGAATSVAVFTNFGDPQDGLRQAILIAEGVASRLGVRILLRFQHANVVEKLNRRFPGVEFDLLPEAAVTFGREAVLREGLDGKARKIHEEWYDEEKKRMAGSPGRPPKATFHPWADLTENQKDSSRSQAEHMAIKIRAAGLFPARAKREWPHVAADAGLVEQLAAMEHNRWCADKWLDGWKYASKRNDEFKHHTDLVPYADLDEPTKQYDRDTIIKLDRYMD